MSVRIYQLSRGMEIWVWLCEKHLRAMKSEGWEVKASKEPPHALHCDNCEAKGKRT